MIYITIAQYIKDISVSVFSYDDQIVLEIPDQRFGDYTTNVAMLIGKLKGINPVEVAEKLAVELRKKDSVSEVKIAGPGFINITLKDDFLWHALLSDDYTKYYAKQKVVIEYSDPNPFKELHVGHLYTSIIGDSIANLVQVGGGDVIE